MTPIKSRRLWEIDGLRGAAVLLMLVSNFLFDLSFFASVVPQDSIFMAWLAKVTAGLFLVLAGVSLHLKYATPNKEDCKKNMLRGLKLFALGMVVTVATKIVVGEGFVIFGILHLIGLGIVLAFPFLRHRWLSFWLGISVLVLAPFIAQLKVNYPWLIWLGVQYEGFHSVDFTPVFPWFGLMLLGVFLGVSLYPQRKQRWTEPRIISGTLFQGLRLLGRHSLFVYFIHQPIFLGGFALVRWLK